MNRESPLDTYVKHLNNKHHINKKIKNIKNVKRCRDGMSKSMQTR